MRFLNIYRVLAQSVDELEILREHIRVLVIFARDVLLDGGGQAESMSFPKRQEKNIAGLRSAGCSKRMEQFSERSYEVIVPVFASVFFHDESQFYCLGKQAYDIVYASGNILSRRGILVSERCKRDREMPPDEHLQVEILIFPRSWETIPTTDFVS